MVSDDFCYFVSFEGASEFVYEALVPSSLAKQKMVRERIKPQAKIKKIQPPKVIPGTVSIYAVAPFFFQAT